MSASCVFVDFETAMDRKAGYSLAKMSTFNYVVDERFEILSVAVAQDDGEISVYHKFGTNGGGLDSARERLAAAAADGATLVSHNLNFEGLILELRWGITFARMSDTAGFLRALDLGASLENGGQLVELEKAEAPAFDKETLRDPRRLEDLALYNAGDVAICRRLFRLAEKHRQITTLEQYVMSRNAQENIRGLKVDLGLACDLVGRFARRREQLLVKLAEEYPDFNTSDLNSTAKVRAYIRAAFGIALETLDRRDMALVRARADHAGLAAFMAYRDGIRTLGTWAKNLTKIAGGSGRIYCPLKYYGAHTGRYSGSGKQAGNINIQNMPQGRDKHLPELAEYRPILVADEDESWVACDLSTIEPRVLAFIARQDDLLMAFRSGRDVYIWFGGQVFPCFRIAKGGENSHLRDLCKQAVIGLGYGMGRNKFGDKVLSEMPDTEEQLITTVYEGFQRFAKIKQLREVLFMAFKLAADQGTPSNVGLCQVRRVSDVPATGCTVAIRLPTGRTLYYRQIKKKQEKVTHQGRSWLGWSYSYARRLEIAGQSNKQQRSVVIPQTLIENVVQAIARDLLLAQQREIEKHAELWVRFSVHDELVVSCPRCTCPHRDEDRPEMDGKKAPVESLHESDCPWLAARRIVSTEMSRVPTCFPALQQLPVACELSDGIRERYGK